MSRRSRAPRRLSLESLEVRCNPAALVPLADFVAEPAPAQAGTHYFDGRFLRADDLMREQGSAASNTNNYFTDDYSLTVGDSSGANLNAFAGQTVRLRIASVNNRGQLIVGVDDATIQPRASTGGGISDLVVDPSNRDTIYLGGTGRDVLVGGSGQDTQTAHELGHTLGFRHEHTRPTSDSPAAGGDGFADIITGVGAQPHVKHGSGTSSPIKIYSSPLDPSGDKIDDIVVGAGGVNGHVKVFDGRTGAEIQSFLAFPGFASGVRVASDYNAVSGRVTGIVADPSDPVGDLGNDWLVGGTGQDQRNAGAPNGRLFLGTQVGVFVAALPSSAGLDVLIGNTGGDRLLETFDKHGRLLIGTDGGIWNSPDKPNSHGTHVAGTIGAVGNNGVGVAESTSAGTTGSFRITFNGQTTNSLRNLESLIDDLAGDVAGATATSGPAFAVLTVGGTTRLY